MLLGLASRLWASLSLRRVDFELYAPVRRAFPGQTLEVELRLANHNFLPLVCAELVQFFGRDAPLLPAEGVRPLSREESALEGFEGAELLGWRQRLKQPSPVEEDAVRAALSPAVREPGVRHVLVAHQYVTGAATCDSEALSLGGADQVSASLFEGFDYVALGHLHSPQRLCGGRVRYCGSPLKYSLSEERQRKAALLGLAAGTLAMTAVMCVCNLVCTPLFMGSPVGEVVKLLLPAIIPFNLAKAAINSVITYLVYKPISRLVFGEKEPAAS